MKKLFRNNNDRLIFGVCSGLADYFEIDTTLVRIIFVASVMFLGMPIFLYLIMAILMPVRK